MFYYIVENGVVVNTIECFSEESACSLGAIADTVPYKIGDTYRTHDELLAAYVETEKRVAKLVDSLNELQKQLESLGN